MRRPFADKRLLGPIVSSSKFTNLGIRDDSSKEVIGVPGTPFPNREKEDLLVIYVLDTSSKRLYHVGDFADDVERKINGRGEFDEFKVEFLNSGKTSAKGFKEQAVLVRVPGNSIAITDSSLDRIEGIIERQEDIEVTERIYEMEGK